MSDSGATRSGSYPALAPPSERPSPPPPPQPGTPEWAAWATRRIENLSRDVVFMQASLARLETDIGRPPVPTTGDAGAGMWALLAGVQTDCKRILEKLDAADASSATWSSRVGRVGWRIVETLIPLAIGAGMLWLSGHWR